MARGRVLLERSLAQLQDNMIKLQVVFPERITEVPADLPSMEAAELAIKRTADYFKALGLPSRLSEVGIDEKYLEIMAEKSASRMKGTYVELTKDEILQIFKEAM